MKTLKKILFALILLFFLILLSDFNNVFAFTVYDYDGNQCEIPDIPDTINLSYGYIYIYTDGWGEQLKVLNNSNSYYYYDGDNSFILVGTATEYEYNGTTWVQTDSLETDDNVRFNNRISLYIATTIYTDILKTDIFFNGSTFIAPYIMDTEENLQSLDMDCITIDSGSVEDVEGAITLVIGIAPLGSSNVESWVYDTVLDYNNTDFYRTGGVNGQYFEIPVSVFKHLLIENYKVTYVLFWYDDGVLRWEEIEVYYAPLEVDETSQTIKSQFNILSNMLSSLSEEEQAKLQEQIELLRQQNDNDVGILEGIKNIVSYLNPLSENFFVYKLVDLLIDALKSLFIPEDEYFNNYFNELMEWFSARFGFFAYPLELILDILNRILSINFTEPIINIPDIEEPFTGVQLIAATSYNFNSLLENSTLKIVHNIYLILVDTVIALSLIHLLKHKFEEVLTK